jgi:hypothetical protein
VTDKRKVDAVASKGTVLSRLMNRRKTVERGDLEDAPDAFKTDDPYPNSAKKQMDRGYKVPDDE